MPASPPTSTQQGCPPAAAPHASRRADSSADRPTKAVAPLSLPTPALSRLTGSAAFPAGEEDRGSEPLRERCAEEAPRGQRRYVLEADHVDRVGRGGQHRW